MLGHLEELEPLSLAVAAGLIGTVGFHWISRKVGREAVERIIPTSVG